VLYRDLDSTAGPHPYLRDKVEAGKLGMKTGEGFRRWTPGEAEAVRQRLSQFLAAQAKARKRANAE
jgi:3-hydroxybutyryl-CoA dehydrogenase